MSGSYRKRLRELRDNLDITRYHQVDGDSEVEAWEVCIIQRGRITKKTVEIWNKKIPMIDSNVQFVKDITSRTKCIVLSEDCTIDKLGSWGVHINSPPSFSLYFLSPSWMVDFIRNGKRPDVTAHLHPHVSVAYLFPSCNVASLGVDAEDGKPQESLFDSPTKKSRMGQAVGKAIPFAEGGKCLDALDKASPVLTTGHVSLAGASSNYTVPTVIPRALRPTLRPQAGEVRATPMRTVVDEGKDSEERDQPLHFFSAPTKARYACMTTGTNAADQIATQADANKHLTSILDQLQEIYELDGDQWRGNTYKKASAALKRMSRVTDSDQLKNVKGFGKSVRDKIQEILSTGTLKKLEHFQNDTAVQLRIEFAKIWGVGPATAHQLVTKGYKSIDDLRQRGLKDLNEQQKVGLHRYEALQERIPRAEVQEIESFVLSHLERMDAGARGVVCGSYRRGKSSSGDVDILIYPDDGREKFDTLLPDLINALSACGFLTDHLTVPSGHHSRDGRDGFATYMGVCKLLDKPDRIHRRLDLKCFPRSCLAFAMLYFTGSDHFNRSIRLYASNMGYTLSDKGLFRCGRDASRIKIWKGSEIPCLTEKEVFEVLKLDYKEPHERNCFDTGNTELPSEEAGENDTDDFMWTGR